MDSLSSINSSKLTLLLVYHPNLLVVVYYFKSNLCLIFSNYFCKPGQSINSDQLSLSLLDN